MKISRVAAIGLATVFLASVLVGQQEPQPPQDGPPQPAQSAPPAQPLAPQQLDDLVAPIALYPDNVLSQILVASTYPLEVVEAQQWVLQNKNLTGQNLTNAAQRQNWDPSVQALVVFPDVLARLNQDIRWTTDLGNAFLAQQADVMAAVQRMRGRAQANGKLQSGPRENVTTQTQNGQTAIQILPTDPGTVYVPNYNPEWVWGPPAYGFYPPLFYPPFGVGFGFYPGIDLGFYFGGGWGLYGGWGWGWGPNWFGGGIFLNAGFFHRYGFRDFHPGFGGSNVWAHDPGHRLGVAYPNRAVANRFGAGAGFRGNAAAGIRGNEGARAGAEGFRGGAAPAARAQSGERFGSQNFERQNPGGNRSAFSGIRSGGETQMRSDHGFSSMGHAGFGGFGGGGGGGFHGGGGGHGGGGHR
jgi:uncharacterized membrane protein YgcG